MAKLAVKPLIGAEVHVIKYTVKQKQVVRSPLNDLHVETLCKTISSVPLSWGSSLLLTVKRNEPMAVAYNIVFDKQAEFVSLCRRYLALLCTLQILMTKSKKILGVARTLNNAPE